MLPSLGKHFIGTALTALFPKRTRKSITKEKPTNGNKMQKKQSTAAI